jgi:two-component system chemotaxis response regulator CheB
MKNTIKVLVVDDAAFMRKAVKDILESDPQIEVVGTAKNGLEGLEKVKMLQPDVITLDMDMPIMDGMASLRHIMIETPVPVVVLSSLFNDGTITFDALRLGVVDFVPKPSGAISTNIGKSRQTLIDRVKIAKSVNIYNVRRVRLEKRYLRSQIDNCLGFFPPDYILSLGTTISGPNTVMRLMSQLPPTLPTAVVVVQEIDETLLPSFVKRFNDLVPWNIEAAEDGVSLAQGTCYISSSESGLRVATNKNGEPCLRHQTGVHEPLNLLFASAAETFRKNTIGVLLTGTGRDGAQGFEKIRDLSGITIAQDAECCVYPNLTANVIEKGAVDIVIHEKEFPNVLEALIQ